jgi:hypothetical protein
MDLFNCSDDYQNGYLDAINQNDSILLNHSLNSESFLHYSKGYAFVLASRDSDNSSVSEYLLSKLHPEAVDYYHTIYNLKDCK